MPPTASGQRGLRLLPIIVGAVVDVVGSIVASVMLTFVVMVLRGPEVLFDRPTLPLVAGWIVLGSTFTVLGGFLAAFIARRREVMHGVGVGILGGIISLFSDPSGWPPWFLLVGAVAGVGAGALGGLAAKWVRGPAPAAVPSADEPPAPARRGRLAIAAGMSVVVAAGAIAIGRSRFVPPEPAAARVDRVYLVPIHAASDVMTRLEDHYREQLGLEIEVLPALPADQASIDADRGQVIAEELVAQLRARFGELTADKRGVVIAVTSRDLYVREHSWQFAFGWRSPPYAVVSYARMHLDPATASSQRALIDTRLRKMVSRYIGMMAYGINPSGDRRSLMFQDIRGVDDLDYIEEDLTRAGFPAR